MSMPTYASSSETNFEGRQTVRDLPLHMPFAGISTPEAGR